jgi:TPR repeat protein
MIEFGDALRWGTGLCLNNPKRAVEWYQRAADIGANRAKLKLYEIYDSGATQRVKVQFPECRQAKANASNNVRPDSTLALLWLGRVAQTSNSAAQAYLAEKMEEGYGMPASQPAIAERYWRRAAYAGSEYAEVELAERLRNGVILVKEEYGSEEVISLLERAKSQGSPRATLYLGQIYRNGEFGQEKNPQKAMQLAYEAIDLAMQADPSTADGNPFYEIAAGHLLVEMSKSGEIHPSEALSEHEVERLTRFYGVVDPDTNRVKIRRLNVPLGCFVLKDRRGNEIFRSTKRAWVWVWDWGRDESPTELQFRNLERRTRCYHNEVYRATLAEVFRDAKKNNVRFADLIQQRIRTAQASVSTPEPERERRRGRRRR